MQIYQQEHLTYQTNDKNHSVGNFFYRHFFPLEKSLILLNQD